MLLAKKEDEEGFTTSSVSAAAVVTGGGSNTEAVSGVASSYVNSLNDSCLKSQGFIRTLEPTFFPLNRFNPFI